MVSNSQARFEITSGQIQLAESGIRLSAIKYICQILKGDERRSEKIAVQLIIHVLCAYLCVCNVIEI